MAYTHRPQGREVATPVRALYIYIPYSYSESLDTADNIGDFRQGPRKRISGRGPLTRLSLIDAL